jgi:vancomycin resistance protein VanJ
MTTSPAADDVRSRPFLLRLPRLILLVLADMFGVYSSILLGLWLVTGERLWVVELFVNLLPGALYPLPVALVIALIFRQPRRVTLQFPAVLAFLIFYAPLFNPSPPPVIPEQTLTLLTYNILFANEDYDSIESIIRTADPDIIALQELTEAAHSALRERLSDAYPHRVETIRERFIDGRATYSRYPISDSQAIDGVAREVISLYTAIDVNGTTVHVYNIHPSRPTLRDGFTSERRTRDIKRALDTVTPRANTILIGDFNTSDVTADYRHITAQYTDVHARVGLGFGTTFENYQRLNRTWLPDWRVVRLDYVFVDTGIVPLATRVIARGNSDHLPVWAEVGIP